MTEKINAIFHTDDKAFMDDRLNEIDFLAYRYMIYLK